MDATFTYAAVYQADAVCLTPLRTGGADGDTETVLRYADGMAFLQGTSLAGALREWLSNMDKAAEETLFGSQQHDGHLIVSDGVFETEAEQSIRPRLKINRRTGSADQGGKFDIAQISRNARLRFTLTWLGNKTDIWELDAVEKMLVALHQGEIRLGAQKSNGFGRVELSVRKRLLDMRSAEDRNAWLNDQAGGTPLMLTTAASAFDLVTFTLSGYTDSILVKASSVEQDGTGSYMPNIREGGCSVLPGPSIKGAVRARAEAVVQFMGADLSLIASLFGRGAENDNGKQGQVRFEDVLLEPDHRRRQTRVRIDRFTGGVMRGGLFCEEPVSGTIKTTITMPNEPAACGLMLYVLRDLGLGLYSLGSGGGIGRGYLRLDQIKVQSSDGRGAMLSFGNYEVMKSDDSSGLFSEWLNALEEICDEN